MNRLSFVFLLTIYGCGGPGPQIAPIQNRDTGPSEAAAIEYSVTDWPLWRGPSQTGIAEADQVPETWSESERVLWKASVPGRGHSSSVIVGDLVFVTTATEADKAQQLICIDRMSGEEKWTTVVHSGGLPRKHPKNSFASATPASDGHAVFVSFVNDNRLQVAALDFSGNILWETEAGAFKSEHGFGSSPTLFEKFVIVAGDGAGAGFLAALDRASGEIVYRVPRQANSGHGSYASPIVAQLAGREQLILSGYNKTISYDPASGEELWYVDGPSTVTGNTVAISDPHVIVSGGYSEKQTMCIKADGSGDVTNSHVVWSTKRNIAYVPSPIIDGENVLVLTGDGILTSYEISSGERNWQERIGGNFSASPIQVGERFYVPNENGEVTVFRAGEKYERIAQNSLASSGGMASIAVSGNRLYLRTSSDLYCIGQPAEEVAAK